MTYSDSSQSSFDGADSINRRAKILTAVAALFAFAVLAAIAAPRAGAVSDEEELTQFGSLGSGAGQLSGLAGIATDPTTGHLYSTDGFNRRVSEFTPWGNFVKAFGWDVAPGAVNEQQEVRVRAAEGQFKLSFGAVSTADLVFNAPGSESEGPGSVEAALNALPSIGGAGGSVSVSAVPGTPDGKTPYIYVVAFKGSLAATNVAELTITGGTTPPNGGIPSSTLEVRTRADGTAGGAGLESCTAESGCKAGLQGSEAGQLAEFADGIAADTAGNIYLKEVTNRRVQKFDSAGRFLLMFGGEVNETTKENICTRAQLEGGDECGIGTPGTAPGQFTGFSRGIALVAGGELVVADSERIQRFNLQGEFEASIPVPGEKVHSIAFDPVSGDLYITYEGGAGLHKLDSTSGEKITELEGQRFLATDPVGNVYAVGVSGKHQGALAQYDSGGKPLSPPSCCAPFPSPSLNIEGLGTNSAGTLYVTYSKSAVGSLIRAFGPAPVIFEAAPKVPPTIVAQFATSVDRKSAVLGAEINPHFWTDTRYYLQYGTGKCSEGGCASEKPLPPGALLTSKVTDAAVKSAGIAVEGLQPGTTYHYRFIAESSGGGPVRGIGGEVGLDGEESTFTTYPTPAPPKTDCPNQGFRSGFSAPLPDCRAYEMVSPVDKNNGDIKAQTDVSNFSNALDLSSTNGNRFTYSASRAFAGAKAAPYTIQYMAARQEGVAWQSKAIVPQQGPSAPLNALENPYKTFSEDLCTGWLMVTAEPVPDPKAPDGYNNIYRRENCGEESHEALVQVEPESGGTGQFYPLLQGTSADGKAAIFGAKYKLTEDAASGPSQTYYASDGELHLVCILPSGLPSGENCTGGTNSTSSENELERWTSLTHAISADGSRVYWTNFGGGKEASGPGKIYLRLNPGEEPTASGVCEEAEPEKACTVKVSETASTKAARFLGASADGSKALFEITEGTQAKSLYLFDLETASSTLLTAKGLGVAGASEDLSHIYFASEEALPETSGGAAGKPNLYLDQEGTKTFIATLASGDVESGSGQPNTNNTSPKPIFHAARATADGTHLAFISTESLTGYDNIDQVRGEADFEVYLYEVGSAGPVCVSCNPSGQRPQGRIVGYGHRAGTGSTAELLPTAAMIPLAQFTLDTPRVFSHDGGRLFFNSYDALLPRDTNGKVDVYQWQAAGSAKDCEKRGDELYVPSSKGCLSLISSGQSPSDSEFLDASENGRDIFIRTNASLLPQDPGLLDIYDAREGGGLPTPPEPPGPCQGEACQFAPPPPNDPTPASASFRGVGNPSASKPRPRCAKGKARRKGRCVTKKHKRAKKAAQRKRAANHNRRASR